MKGAGLGIMSVVIYSFDYVHPHTHQTSDCFPDWAASLGKARGGVGGVGSDRCRKARPSQRSLHKIGDASGSAEAAARVSTDLEGDTALGVLRAGDAVWAAVVPLEDIEGGRAKVGHRIGLSFGRLISHPQKIL